MQDSARDTVLLEGTMIWREIENMDPVHGLM